MTMFFAKKLNKKGFTLAELLIVVAIIAVLVAIAVPIFTSSLETAKARVKDANMRVVRVTAVNAILQDQTKASPVYGAGPWQATAKVNSNGEITELKIKTNSGSITESCTEDSSNGYTVVVKVDEIDGELDS